MAYTDPYEEWKAQGKPGGSYDAWKKKQDGDGGGGGGGGLGGGGGYQSPGFFGGAGDIVTAPPASSIGTPQRFGGTSKATGSGGTAAIGGAGSLYSTGGSSGGGGPVQVTVPAMPDLSIYAKPSPEMKAATEAWKKRMAELEAKAKGIDPNLQWQIEEYKRRMGEDTTTRAIEQAAAVIRSQAAGMGEAGAAAGAATGRGPGYGAAGIGDASAAALAKSAANIELGRQQQLDQLLLGGQSIMGAPGEQTQQYEAMLSQMYGLNPYEATAKLGLAQQGLGLEAYLGNLNASTNLARAQADMYGSPLQWYQMLLGGI